MPSLRPTFSRRAALGLAALAVAGCSGHHATAGGSSPSPSASPAAPPDEAALQLARDGEQVLLSSYDAKIRHAKRHERPALEVQRAIHAAHLSALKAAKPDGADIAVAVHLRRQLKASARQLRQLAQAATSGANAALFASIAASHEVSAQTTTAR